MRSGYSASLLAGSSRAVLRFRITRHAGGMRKALLRNGDHASACFVPLTVQPRSPPRSIVHGKRGPATRARCGDDRARTYLVRHDGQKGCGRMRPTSPNSLRLAVNGKWQQVGIVGRFNINDYLRRIEAALSRQHRQAPSIRCRLDAHDRRCPKRAIAGRGDSDREEPYRSQLPRHIHRQSESTHLRLVA